MGDHAQDCYVQKHHEAVYTGLFKSYEWYKYETMSSQQHCGYHITSPYSLILGIWK